MLFSIYQIVLQQHRGWNAGVGELPLLGTGIGACLGGMALFWLSMKEAKAGHAGHQRVSEARLPAAIGRGILFAVTMFWFAWTAEFNLIHWIVPTLAGTFLATSIILIFGLHQLSHRLLPDVCCFVGGCQYGHSIRVRCSSSAIHPVHV